MTNCTNLPGFLLIELSITLMLSILVLLAFSFFMHTCLEQQKYTQNQLTLFNKTISSVERLIAECIANNKKPEHYSIETAEYMFSCTIKKPYAQYEFYTFLAVGSEHNQTLQLLIGHTFL